MRLRINDRDVILHDIRANNLTKHKTNKSNVFNNYSIIVDFSTVVNLSTTDKELILKVVENALRLC